jgi:invasion protein IalB
MRHQNFLPGSLNTAIISTAALFLLPLWSPAFAQQTRPAGEAPSVQQPPETEFAPRGQRLSRDIKYGDWQKVCFKTPAADMVCRTTISGTFETGQFAVRVNLIERHGKVAARLQLFLPVGLYLPAGVKLTVDKGAQHQIPYVWCLTNACIAANVADASLIKKMEGGKTLQLEIVDPNMLTVTTTVSLDRFAAVHKGDPAQVFQQDIDE